MEQSRTNSNRNSADVNGDNDKPEFSEVAPLTHKRGSTGIRSTEQPVRHEFGERTHETTKQQRDQQRSKWFLNCAQIHFLQRRPPPPKLIERKKKKEEENNAERSK